MSRIPPNAGASVLGRRGGVLPHAAREYGAPAFAKISFKILSVAYVIAKI